MPLEFLALTAQLETAQPAATEAWSRESYLLDPYPVTAELSALDRSFRPTTGVGVYDKPAGAYIHFGTVGLEVDDRSDSVLYNLYHRSDRVGEWNVGLGATDPSGPGLLFGANLSLDFDLDDY